MPQQLTLKDHLFETRLVMNRAIILLVFGGILLLVLLSRLLYLQVLSHEHFTTLSEDNRVKLQPIPPNRGLIFDRNGILLAENLPSYRLEITPEQIDDMGATLDALEGILEIRDIDRSRFEKLRKRKYDLDDNGLRPYFPLEQVRDGVFAVANKLYGLTFHERDDLKRWIFPAALPNGQSGVTVNDANVISTNVRADNGVIHVIDKVLLPK